MTTWLTIQLPRTVADCRDSRYCAEIMFARTCACAQACTRDKQCQLSRQSATVRGSTPVSRGAP